MREVLQVGREDLTQGGKKDCSWGRFFAVDAERVGCLFCWCLCVCVCVSVEPC